MNDAQNTQRKKPASEMGVIKGVSDSCSAKEIHGLAENHRYAPDVHSDREIAKALIRSTTHAAQADGDDEEDDQQEEITQFAAKKKGGVETRRKQEQKQSILKIDDIKWDDGQVDSNINEGDEVIEKIGFGKRDPSDRRQRFRVLRENGLRHQNLLWLWLLVLLSMRIVESLRRKGIRRSRRRGGFVMGRFILNLQRLIP
jgi:hypothetical protein